MAAVTHTSAGSGQSLVATPSGGTITNKSLIGAGGISLDSTATDVTINIEQLETCILINSTHTAITNGSAVVINYDTELYDPSDMHSTMTNPQRIYIQSDGLYQINFSSGWTSSASVTAHVTSVIWKYDGTNNINLTGTTGLPTTPIVLCCSCITRCNAGDFIYTQCGNSSGVNLNVYSSLSQFGSNIHTSPRFSVTKLSD